MLFSNICSKEPAKNFVKPNSGGSWPLQPNSSCINAHCTSDAHCCVYRLIAVYRINCKHNHMRVERLLFGRVVLIDIVSFVRFSQKNLKLLGNAEQNWHNTCEKYWKKINQSK